MATRKPTEIVQYKLRIRESLRRKIEKAAKQGKTSANQEMAERLERSFRDEASVELAGIVERAKAAFGNVDWSVLRVFTKQHDLFHAASVLLAEIKQQLPADEIENRAALKEAMLNCAKAIQSTKQAFDAVVEAEKASKNPEAAE